MKKKFNSFAFIIILVAMALWAFAPFVAVNIITMGDPPSAYDLITGNFVHIGSISGSSASLACMGSIIALAGALVFQLVDFGAVRKFFAVIGIASMIPNLMEYLEAFGDSFFEDFFDIYGIGYVGILIIFVMLLFMKNAKSTQPANNTYGNAPENGDGFGNIQHPESYSSDDSVQYPKMVVFKNNDQWENK